jgi:glycosyltransferase involved in cell wall biosynthesis
MNRQVSSPLNLLAVTHYPPMPGGSSRSCALLWHGTARRGHRVRVLGPITKDTRDFDRQRRPSAPKTLTVSRFTVPDFHLKPYDVEGYRHYQAIEQEQVRAALPTLIDECRPDVVISAHETLGEAVIDVTHAKGLPCALVLRGSPTWQIVTGQYPGEAAERYLDLYRRADVAIAVGQYMQPGLQELGVANVAHIPNLVDLELFSPSPRNRALAAEHRIADDAVVVLHASMMTSRKRPEDVLRSAAFTLPVAPKLVYVFVGGEDRAAQLKALNHQQGTESRVRFIDGVPYDDMPNYIRLSDMVVLASEGEGLARIAIETQASGRVLIASDIPAGLEVVRHGETGLLFKMGDVEDLAAQIARGYGDPALRDRIGTAARQQAARHEIGSVIDAYVQTLSELRANHARV